MNNMGPRKSRVVTPRSCAPKVSERTCTNRAKSVYCKWADGSKRQFCRKKTNRRKSKAL